ncbi:MAG: exodeoxyribonuclease VII small subunit [Elusimicrobiota bacterium]|jgi:exodeoxyribonuclease VII small subunit|nr:exodeoxyribonuclease VII small subunit [Elusimicrobiota bacterium]
MTKQNTFEAKLARLEEIVNILDGESLNLDDAAILFEEGTELSKQLSLKLKEIKFKVEALRAKGADLELEPFSDEPQKQNP